MCFLKINIQQKIQNIDIVHILKNTMNMILLNLMEILQYLSLYHYKKCMKQRVPSKSVRSTPASHSKSQTQQLRPSMNDKQWGDILQGIDAIANKLKQLTNEPKEQNNKSYNSNNKKKSKQLRSCSQSKKQPNLSNIEQKLNRQKSLVKDKRCSQSARKKYKMPPSNHSIYGNKSEKWLKRVSTCSSSVNKSIKKGEQSNTFIPHTQQHTQSKYLKAANEIINLKELNQKLMKKNQQLQQKLLVQSQDLNNLRKKIKRHKENQIVLRIINDDEKNKLKIKSSQHISGQQISNKQICIQIKPTLSIFRSTIDSSQNKKKNTETEQTQKKRLIDLSKHEKNSTQQTTKNGNRNNDPSQIRKLQSQFDRLMQLSHFERNKAKKKIIWDQMKCIANQLKMIRYFTQH